MTMNTLFCPYCMKPVIGSEGTVGPGCCSVCGKDPEAYVPSSHHLSPGTLLRDRYLLGCVLGEGGYGITYIGYDSLLQNRVAVKEYFPVELCTRDTIGGNSVNILSGIPAKNYARGMHKYLTEARLLAKMEKQRLFLPCVMNSFPGKGAKQKGGSLIPQNRMESRLLFFFKKHTITKTCYNCTHELFMELNGTVRTGHFC